MASDWFQNRDTGLLKQLTEIAYLSDAETQVLLIDHFAKSTGHRFQVTTSQSSIRGKALYKDQHIGNPLNPLIVVQAEESPNIHKTVLLGRHRTAVSIAEQLTRDLHDGLLRITRLSFLDEETVLCKPTGVEEQRNTVPIHQLSSLSDIAQGDRLATPTVVGDR